MRQRAQADCPSSEDLVGYALGALDPADQRSVAAHLPGCERCAGELRHLGPAVAVLAESVEQVEPPETLRQNLMAAVHAEAAEASGDQHARPARRERVRGFFWRPAAVLGAVALIAAGAIGYVLSGEDQKVETYGVEALAPGAGGTLEVSGDDATLHAHGMRQLAKGAVYQVWVAEDGEVTPSAAFVPHADGTATAAVPEAASGADAVMVTREPRPGRSSPSLPAVLNAELD